MGRITYLLALCFVCCASAQSEIFKNLSSGTESCRTPNGEVAKCISIYNCPKLYESGKSGDPDAFRFLEQSVCRKTRHNVFVCCGSDTDFKEKKPMDEPRQNVPEGNDLIAENKDCGYMSPDFRILGGSETGLGEFPWMALLEYRHFPSGRRKFLCGGSLIGKRHILTAAHCVTGTKLSDYKLVNIRLGEWNTSSSTDCIMQENGIACSDPVLNVGFERITPHTGFGGLKNDIALIRLDRDITYSKFVSPICIPMDEKQLKPNTTYIVAGWGETESGMNSIVKLKVQVPIVKNEICHWKYRYSQNTLICAGGKKLMDSCKGDSGGPLMFRDVETGQWTAVGIVSQGIGCGNQGLPAYYTKVDQFSKWIRMHAY